MLSFVFSTLFLFKYKLYHMNMFLNNMLFRFSLIQHYKNYIFNTLLQLSFFIQYFQDSAIMLCVSMVYSFLLTYFIGYTTTIFFIHCPEMNIWIVLYFCYYKQCCWYISVRISLRIFVYKSGMAWYIHF